MSASQHLQQRRRRVTLAKRRRLSAPVAFSTWTQNIDHTVWYMPACGTVTYEYLGVPFGSTLAIGAVLTGYISAVDNVRASR